MPPPSHPSLPGGKRLSQLPALTLLLMWEMGVPKVIRGHSWEQLIPHVLQAGLTSICTLAVQDSTVHRATLPTKTLQLPG